MIGTHQVDVLAKFYEALFDKKPEMEEGGWYGWSVGNTFITIGEHSEVKEKSQEPQRIILNFETKNVKEEFERISKIEGVGIIKEPYDIQGALIATLSDPDGNYLQLMTPWEG